MKSFLSALSALALALPIFGAPTSLQPLEVKRSSTGAAKADSYIVVLKSTASKAAHLDKLQQAVTTLGDSSLSNIIYNNEYSTVLNGYAAILKGAALKHVLEDPSVAYVEEDGLVQINYSREDRELTVEERAAAESHAEFLRSLQSRGTGAGVNIYGIDTGISTTHTSFGGRASWGATFGGYADVDGHGHGTHTAATAVGNTYGVATQANVIAVKVLGDGGSGAWSDVIAGIDWAVSNGLASNKPSIATMSLGGGSSAAVDDAVSSGIYQGIHFTVAAGNSNTDASGTSPAETPAANTVGAVDSNNVKAWFSNYGPILDVWAPGVNILSAWIGSDSATAVLSGTSMATPFVAGVLASAISQYGNKWPAELTADLTAHARPIVSGNPSGTTNLLATLW